MIIDSWGSPTLRQSSYIEIHTKYIKFMNHIFVVKFDINKITMVRAFNLFPLFVVSIYSIHYFKFVRSEILRGFRTKQ